jgi:two-component system, NtrC family, response regulator AtoC
MRAIEAIIADIAPTDIPVLLMGETGTGKEVLALQIHRNSGRRHGPFVKVRCSGLSLEEFNSLMQPEATENERSIESAIGTVLFDEVGGLDAACQNRLLETLSLLDSRVSGTRRVHGVISTTSQNLEAEVKAGHFRDELYYRISGVCLRLPPLRQRREDIPVLLEFFISKYCEAFAHPRPSVSTDGLLQFQTYSWPGNVRELESAVRKLVATGNERVALNDLPGADPRDTIGAGGRSEPHSLKEAAKAASRQAERELILKVLTRTRWNRKRAAQELRVSYKALLYKLKQIGLEDSGL